MDPQYLQAFRAVKDFIELILWKEFSGGKKVTPLSLYRHVLKYINDDLSKGPIDVGGINKVLSGFRQFLCTYETQILDNKMDAIPRGSVINYGDGRKAYLEIQKYIFICNKRRKEEVVEEIREHLMTISAILEPTEEKLNKLESLEDIDIDDIDLGIDTNTKEGQFIGGIINKTRQFKEETGTTGNGAADMMGILQSGIVTDMFAGLQGINDGEMDPVKMFGAMQNVLGALSSATQAQRQNVAVEEIDDEKQKVPAIEDKTAEPIVQEKKVKRNVKELDLD